MPMLTKYEADVPRVERFNWVERYTHWGHTVSYLLCLFTGLAMFLPINAGGSIFATIFGGYDMANLIHRISAVVLTAFLIFFVTLDAKGIWLWIQDILRFGLNDIKFIMKFPLEFFGFHVEVAPQTKFNGGEKGNSMVTPTMVILLVLSGYVMWSAEIWHPLIVQIAYPVHSLAMVFGTVMVSMHGYLGSFHPGSGESFWGMWKGTVKEDWAKHHHAVWYEETYGSKKKDAE